MNPYDILGVDKSASKKDIQRATRKLAVKYHPDKNLHLSDEKKKKAEEMYKKIQKAKDLLLDDKRREMYDRFGITSDEEMAEKMGGMGGMGGMPGFPSGMGVNMHDLFSSFSGRSQSRQMPPVRVPVMVTLEELYNGVDKKVSFERIVFKKDNKGNSLTCSSCKGKGRITQVIRRGPMVMQNEQPCSACNATGYQSKTEKVTSTVSIKKGLGHDSEIVIPNQGNELPKVYQTPTKKKSDVHVIVREKEHPVFKHNFRFNGKVRSEDILIEREITLAEALCGYHEQIKHISGKDITLEIDDTINDGDIMFVEGKGMPKQNSPGFGNLLIKFNVSEKKINLSDKARKVLWEELTGKKWSDRQKQTTVSEDEDVPRIRNIKELNTSSTDFDEDVDENDGPTECTHS